jgi:hypothetical protein
VKQFFDKNWNGQDYDAVSKRKGQDLYYIQIGGKPGQAKQQQVVPPRAKKPLGVANQNKIATKPTAAPGGGMNKAGPMSA